MLEQHGPGVEYEIITLTPKQLAAGAPSGDNGTLPSLLIQTGGRAVFVYTKVFLRGDRAVIRFARNILFPVEDEEAAKRYSREMALGILGEAIPALSRFACRAVIFVCGQQLSSAVFSGPEPIDPANILA